jgi:hypothetical protein
MKLSMCKVKLIFLPPTIPVPTLTHGLIASFYIDNYSSNPVTVRIENKSGKDLILYSYGVSNPFKDTRSIDMVLTPSYRTLFTVLQNGIDARPDFDFNLEFTNLSNDDVILSYDDGIALTQKSLVKKVVVKAKPKAKAKPKK